MCIRNFYTGLPVKGPAKKLGLLYQESQDNLPINILGSYNEGFFDPLTGQLRQIPLEIILIEGTQKLSYSYSRRFAEPNFEVGEAKFVPETTSKQLLTFETPGLVAFNHPIGNPNGGSSEFFALQSSATKDGTLKRSMLDGQYAPFGYIIEGFDIFDSLEPGDIIDSTIVDGFGQQNLVKIRSSTFKEVAQGTEEASAKAKNRPSTSTSKEPKEGTEETTVKAKNKYSTLKELKEGTEEITPKAKNRSSTLRELKEGTEEVSAKAKNRSSTSKELKEGTQEMSPKKEAKDTTLQK